MNSLTPTGVIFDMDGVLVDSADAHFRSWRLLAPEVGGTVTEEQFTATFGRQNRDIIPILFGDVPKTRLGELERQDVAAVITDDPVETALPVWPRADVPAIAVRLLDLAR